MSFGDFQHEIYSRGRRGMAPRLPVAFASLEARAGAAMPPALLSHVRGGCGDEFTQRHNADAFRCWGMVPRMMVDTAVRDLSVRLFGLTLPTPIFMSPIGVTSLCTGDGQGDLAAARAAVATGVPLVASTLSGNPLEAVAAALGDTPGFFQLYAPKDPDLAASLVGRAEAAGYRAIVVTLDTCVTGWRPCDLDAASAPHPHDQVLANYFSDPVFQAMLAVAPEDDPAAAKRRWHALFGRVLTWADMPWLRSLTKLPLVLKGICHPDDARRAIDGGADAIYCSNHGGRQANGGIAAIDMLPGVVAGAGRAPVLFDSGVRSGSDVVKAIALGAAAVGIGRPYAYGLALGGADGAAHVLRSILAEADLLMAVNGYPGLADVAAAGAIRNDVAPPPHAGS